MKTRHIRLHSILPVLSLASCLLSSLAPASSAFAAPPITVRASVSSTGAEGNSYSSFPSLSGNGRLVAFFSAANNLVTGDNNDIEDIFVHDLKTRVTQRVSLSSSGIEGNSQSLYPAISANGRFVTFLSIASNLVIGDYNGTYDVFVRNLKTGVTERVSVDSTGTGGNGNTLLPAVSPISGNGRFVAFTSDASDLVEEDNNNIGDVFVRDIIAGVTQRVSVNTAGKEGNNSSLAPSISANGSLVAFYSNATNLIEEDNNGTKDVFVRDFKTGVTQRVSVSSSGAEGNGDSYNPALSANGRFVAFVSLADNLVAEDNNGQLDVFTRDLKTGITQRVSLNSAGIEGNNSSYGPVLSADGRFVSFYSYASNLVENDNIGLDVFVRNLKTGVTQRVSVSSSGAEGNGDSYLPTISANGRVVAFTSDASNLVLGDRNGFADIFVRRR